MLGLPGAASAHEFEIELHLDSDYVLKHTTDYLAQSMLLKACDFVDAHGSLTMVAATGAHSRS